MRKQLIIAAAIIAVAAISGLLAMSASNGTAQQQSSDLPVDGAPDE